MRMVDRARGVASKCLRPLAARAAKAYVAGERLEDALRVADKLSEHGLGITLGYWDSPKDTPRGVADAYLDAIDAAANRPHAYVSIKVPALDFSHELSAEVVDRAALCGVRVHFDALGPETAERSRALFDCLLDRGAELSYTLPGRWLRSVSDATWAAERKIVVRVVKGQWADPANPLRDPRRGYLELIDALAGRAAHVAVASHDTQLVAAAAARLKGAKTSCELELLHGLPMRRSLAQADALSLGVHVYVPYGETYLPYALSRLRQNPRVLWWLLRDLFASHGPDSRVAPRRPELVLK
jgi:proline dehydrogenase